MPSLMSVVIENYNEILEAKTDPEMDSWLFMRSPVPVITLLVAYLYFVLKLGPQLMANRPAFNLKGVIIAYNAYQVLFSIWLCGQVFYFKSAIVQLLGQSCRGASRNSEESIIVATCGWWYFMSKIVELMDTVFFVLRKKQSQVTFLHVYHHGIMMLFTWFYLKFLSDELGLFIGFLNSFVHIIMYSYYLIAALGPKYQKYLWWKKYMTWIQLTQFCIMLVYLSSFPIMGCKLSRSVIYFFAGNIVIFLYLFANFYRKSYTKKGARAATVTSEGYIQADKLE